MERTILLARAMYAINGLDTATLAEEAVRLEKLASLCLPMEPAEHEEDGIPGGLLSASPEARDL